MLLVSVAYLVLAPTAGASGGPQTGKIEAIASEKGQLGQYHGTEGRQYHGIEARFGRISAWRHPSGGFGTGLNGPISVAVISPFFTSHLQIPGTKLQKSPLSRGRITDQNDRSIGAQIGAGTEPQNRDPRLMLQIGGIFGLVYVAFLAVWFWATRFRMRPTGSARA